MRRFSPVAILLVLALPALAADPFDTPAPRPAAEPPGGAARPSQPADVAGVSGAYAYRAHCASCHGAAGKGDGPLADGLRYHPADLTRIAQRHGGSFPAEKMVRIVDGRDPLKGHGGPDMPVWGDAFKNADTNYDDRVVREKIRSIVEYLRTIQVK
jgi:mono/diheme cytochrome c family protein